MPRKCWKRNEINEYISDKNTVVYVFNEYISKHYCLLEKDFNFFLSIASLLFLLTIFLLFSYYFFVFFFFSPFFFHLMEKLWER